ncbi:MAG: SulP family inorganic anion transporter [Clostridia bacterium]|nr:SulP family inorganic anion transporter [Clostridia bacterium]
MKKKSLFGQFGDMLKNEFKGYSGKSLLSDIIAGITVGAVALPLALAFGAASVGNADPSIGIVAGMITAIIAGIISGLLGGGSFQISGPTGAMTVILGAVVAGEHSLTGMFAASLIAGIILLVAGILHFGKVIKFIPKPVVTGFTSGIAVVIALGQLGNFFGVELSGETTIDKVIYFFTDCIDKISLPAVICSLAVVLLMAIYPKKAAKYIPGSLAAIIVITVVTALFKVPVESIGSIPRTFINSEHLAFNDISLDLIGDVASSAITIALLGMVESLLCGACAANMKKESFNSNIELVAQGVSNIVIPFFGGVPSTAAIARTSVAVKSGGKTRLASLFHSVFLIACMFILSGAIGLVPYAALAGVLVMTAVRMNEFDAIKCYFKNKMWGPIAQFLITMIATVLLDLTYAIVIGVALSFILYGIDMAKLGKNRSKLTVASETENGKATVKVKGVCYFANADKLSAIHATPDDVSEVTLDLSGMCYFDYTVCETLYEVYEGLKASGKKVNFTGTPKDAEKTLKIIGAEI